METSHFPQVSLRQETTVLRFPGFQVFQMWKPQGTLGKFPTRKSVENHMETPLFRQVSLTQETTALRFPSFTDVETLRKLQVSYKEICGKPHGNPTFSTSFPKIGTNALQFSEKTSFETHFDSKICSFQFGNFFFKIK